jgi:hypothetical protein
MKKIIIIIIFSFFAAPLISQQIVNDGPEKLDKKMKTEAVNNIAKILDENYIFPDIGKKMGELIQNKLKNEDYNDIEDQMQFCMIVTQDLQSVSKDKHVNLRISPQMAAQIKNNPLM